MDKKQIAEFIEGQDWHTSRLGLGRIQDLLFRLGNPQKKLKFIHVTGTNGKGSVCAMLESVYRTAGYKTGLFTSPHLEHYTERIRVNGEEIPEKSLITLTQIVRRQEKEMNEPLTEFELLTAVALTYFFISHCDIVILEVGLGGRLDATNVIPPPEAAVFTPIGLDHVDQLGNSVERIAAEKAGIIKAKSEVVSSLQLPAVQEVLSEASIFVGNSFTYLPAEDITLQKTDSKGQVFDFGIFHNIQIPLHGIHQIYNAATAIMTIRLLREKGWDVSKKDMYDGLANVKWPGRFEILHDSPVFILDGAHNSSAINSLLQSIRRYWSNEKIGILIGVLADKNYELMIESLIPVAWKIVTVTPNSNRSLPADQLTLSFKEKGYKNVVTANSVEEGINLLLNDSDPSDVLVALGSLYLSADVKACFPLISISDSENLEKMSEESNPEEDS